jgi:DMATS type aromatic prenyltransferase
MLKLVKPTEAPTYREFGLQKLADLLGGLGLAPELPAATRLFDLLTGSWGQRVLPGTPLWASDITDDGTPFELSVAFTGGRPHVRVLAEAQKAPFDVESNWEAGLALNRELALLPGVDLERFERVQAFFAPPSGSNARFALWHAGAVEPDGNLSFKVYLNPRIVGEGLSREIVRESLVRLGADYAWDELAPKLTDDNLLPYFSLDLSKSASARVKVYVAHPHATSEQVDALVRHESGYRPGLARSWIEELTGSTGTFDERPLLTCYGFRSPLDAAEVTVHVPTRSYVNNDGESVLRAGKLLGAHASHLRTGVEGMAGRPLAMGRGLVSCVALRPVADGTRLTTYLAPEAHAISTPRRTRLVPASATFARASSS